MMWSSESQRQASVVISTQYTVRIFFTSTTTISIIYTLKYKDFDFVFISNTVKNKENVAENKEKNSNSVPQNLGMRSTVIFNLRPSPTIEVRELFF